MKPDVTASGKQTRAFAIIASRKKKTHSEMILEHLQAGHSVTFLESLELFQCRALAQRISELRAKGHPIKSKMIETKNGAKIARYWLEKNNKEER